jgi:hypothetical protein
MGFRVLSFEGAWPQCNPLAARSWYPPPRMMSGWDSEEEIAARRTGTSIGSWTIERVLGATMFHLLGGRYVHGDLEGARLLVVAATRPAPPLASIAPHVPAPVCSVIDNDWSLNLDER